MPGYERTNGLSDVRTAALATIGTRLPPTNVGAEQALLGAILSNNRAYERVSEFLQWEHFADPAHGRIYRSASMMIEAGKVADPITLRAEFEHSGVLDEAGGTAYLAKLLTAMVGIINAGDYGHAIHDAWIRRQLIDIGETAVNRAFTPDKGETGGDQIEAAEQSLFELATRGSSEMSMRSLAEAMADAIATAERAFKNDGAASGLSTGLRDLDRKTGGLHPSDLVILAGRPGMGKTALATRIAMGAVESIVEDARKAGPDALPRRSVAIFSLEMSAEQLANRILSERTRLPGDRVRRGEISRQDLQRYKAGADAMRGLPLHIDDTPALTLSALRTRCRRLRRTAGLSLVVVDYLQLMRPPSGTRSESRVLEISMITQGLKALAKELKVPVLALSQLSRAVEAREDKRPQLSDLRESGSIEQDADTVMFVYRDEYYLQQRAPKEMAFDSASKFEAAMGKWERDMAGARNKAELLLEKQRHGPTGKVDLHFEGEFTKFANLDLDHAQGPHR